MGTLRGWFESWFQPDKIPEGNADALMRVAATAKDGLRRRKAIFALAWVPCTDEIFVFLQTMLGDPALADAAIYSLVKSGDPRGKIIALKIAKSGGPLAKAAAESVGFDLRTPAELLEVATKSDSYYAVERAVNALAAWGTSEADKALKIFREGTRRNLEWERIEPLDSTGREYEGEAFYTVRSSRDLGQQPTAEERELKRARAAEERLRGVFASLLSLAQPDDIAEFARRCLEDPGESSYSFWKLRGYLEQAGNNANASELRRHIDKGDKARLETYLLNLGSIESVALLELLGCNDLWDRLLECERIFWRSNGSQAREVTTQLCVRFPDDMLRILVDIILERSVSSPVAVVALGHCKNCTALQLKPVLERLRPLLADARWTIRRQALTILLRIQNNVARDMLRDYLATETDFELQILAKDFLRTETTQ